MPKRTPNFKMPEVLLPVFPDADYNIVDFGARRGGLFNNTTAINNAVQACHTSGGGRVIIPEGHWLTGPIQLLDNVNLHADRGAFIMFTKNYNEYPLIMSYFEGYPSIRCTSPIHASDCENIAITGNGIFDGSGSVWWYRRRWEHSDEAWNYLVKWGGFEDTNPKRHVWWPTKEAKLGNDYFLEHSGLVSDFEEAGKYISFFRPCMVELIRCKKILLQSATFQNSPAWTLHPFMCEHITVDGVYAKSPWNSPNTDGLNLECSRIATVKDSVFDVGDDGICLKSGKNAAGRKIGMPTEYISIENCSIYAAHGGFVIGTETACGIRNITVNNCSFTGTDRGLRFKSCFGRGGTVENIYISNIKMHDILKGAIAFNMSKDLGAMPKDTPRNPDGSFLYQPDDFPAFRNIFMDDITCCGADSALTVIGLQPISVKDIFLTNVTLEAKHGIEYNGVNSMFFENVEIINELNHSIHYKFEKLALGEEAFAV